MNLTSDEKKSIKLLHSIGKRIYKKYNKILFEEFRDIDAVIQEILYLQKCETECVQSMNPQKLEIYKKILDNTIMELETKDSTTEEKYAVQRIKAIMIYYLNIPKDDLQMGRISTNLTTEINHKIAYDFREKYENEKTKFISACYSMLSLMISPITEKKILENGLKPLEYIYDIRQVAVESKIVKLKKENPKGTLVHWYYQNNFEEISLEIIDTLNKQLIRLSAIYDELLESYNIISTLIQLKTYLVLLPSDKRQKQYTSILKQINDLETDKKEELQELLIDCFKDIEENYISKLAKVSLFPPKSI